MYVSRRLLLIVCFSIMLIFNNSRAFALETDTHKYLNMLIAQGNYGGWSLNSYLKENLNFTNGVFEPILGYSENVWQRIELGGYKEDITGVPYIRSIRHFHDPLVEDWNSSGFKGSQSSIIWAETKNQSVLLGNYSWPDAREYFYKALTATNGDIKNTNYAECFRAIGQVMHLAEDASVPEHVRDDFHAFYCYENKVNKLQDRPGALQDMLPSPTDKVDSSLLSRVNYNLSATIPIAGLFDNDKYTSSSLNPAVTMNTDIGLAEYTNANFFSRDTVAGKYQYPSLSSCQKGDWVWVQDPKYPNDPSKQVRRKYYTKTSNGETGYRLACLSREWIWGSIYMPEDKAWLTVRDDNVYEDYARKLIPKAVTYSAGLLNYFFRGQIEAVDAATITDTDGKISAMTLRARNKTPKVGSTTGEIEPIGGGDKDKLVVAYQYTQGGQTTFGNSTTLAFNNYSGHTYEFTGFKPPIPADATDNKYILVYRGKLGEENDTVAGKSFVTEGPYIQVEEMVSRFPEGDYIAITDVTKSFDPVITLPANTLNFRVDFKGAFTYPHSIAIEIFGKTASGELAWVYFWDEPTTGYQDWTTITIPNYANLTQITWVELYNEEPNWWGYPAEDGVLYFLRKFTFSTIDKDTIFEDCTSGWINKYWGGTQDITYLSD